MCAHISRRHRPLATSCVPSGLNAIAYTVALILSSPRGGNPGSVLWGGFHSLSTRFFRDTLSRSASLCFAERERLLSSYFKRGCSLVHFSLSTNESATHQSSCGRIRYRARRAGRSCARHAASARVFTQRGRHNSPRFLKIRRSRSSVLATL